MWWCEKVKKILMTAILHTRVRYTWSQVSGTRVTASAQQTHVNVFQHPWAP